MSEMSERTICGLTPRLFAYVAGVVTLGAGVLGLAGAHLAAQPPSTRGWLGLGLFFGLSAIAELHPVPLDEERNVSLAFVFLIAAWLIFGWQAAVPVAALSIFLPHLYRGRPVLRASFNGGTYALAAAGAGAVQFVGPLQSHDGLRMSVYVTCLHRL